MKDQIKSNKKVENKQKYFQKQIFCYYCATYQDSVHYCTKKKCHINYDRNNKVIIEAETEAAAERKGNYEIYGDWNKMKTF